MIFYFLFICVAYDLRIHRVGGSHLERRGSRRHMTCQTGVRRWDFLIRHRRYVLDSEHGGI